MSEQPSHQLATALETFMRTIVAEEVKKQLDARPIGPQLPAPRKALTKTEAAEYLSVSLHTIWKLAATGQIARTSYGTYPVASLDEHLAEEMRKAKGRT